MKPKYTISWTNDGGEPCVLSIFDHQRNVDNTLTLKPAERPFITEVDSELDVMKPVRTGNGTITILSSITSIDEDLFTSDNRFRVVLEVDGEVMWLGWLSGNCFNQPYDNLVQEIQFNCIDDIAALASKSFKYFKDDYYMENDIVGYDFTGDFVNISFREWLTECFILFDCQTRAESGAYYYDEHRFIFNNQIAIHIEGLDLFKILDYKVNRYNFFSENENEDGDKYVGATYLDFLEEFCKTFFFTCYQDGKKIVFARQIDEQTEFYDNLTLQDIHDSTSRPTSYEMNIALSQLTPRGTHDITTKSAAKKVEIVVTPNKVDDALSMPQIDLKDVTANNSFLRNLSQWTDDEGVTHRGKWLCRPFQTGTVEAIMWSFDDRSRWYKIDGQPYNYAQISNLLSHESASGAVLCNEDYWESASYDTGSSPTDAEKKSYNFHNRIYITAGTSTGGEIPEGVTRPDSCPALVMDGIGSATYTRGGFNISFKAHEGLVLSQGPALYNGLGFDFFAVAVRCQLRVGDNYWDGSSWVHAKSYFTIYTEQHDVNSMADVASNKHYTMDIDAEDFVIPVGSSPLTGKVHFEIIWATHSGFVNKATGLITNPTNTPCIAIEDLEISYGQQQTTELTKIYKKEKSDYRYIKQKNDGTGDDKSVNLSIHSLQDNISAYSNLIEEDYGEEKPIDKIGNTKLESIILSEYEEEALRNRQFIELNIDGALNPGNLLVGTQATGYYNILANSNSDWKKNSHKYTLVKL